MPFFKGIYGKNDKYQIIFLKPKKPIENCKYIVKIYSVEFELKEFSQLYKTYLKLIIP